MKTTLMLMIALSTPAMADNYDYYQPYNDREPYPVRIPEPYQEPLYQPSQPVMVVPVEPTRRGYSYYGPNTIRTPNGTCNTTLAGTYCMPH